MTATIPVQPQQQATPTPAPAFAVPAPTGPAVRRVTAGQPISVPPEEAASIIAGANVRKGIDQLFVALADGNVRLSDGMLSVQPLLAIDGAAKPSAPQPIDFDGDVVVDGGLNVDGEFRCSGDLFVSGPVQALELRIGRSLLAHGELVGRRGDRFCVGEDLFCDAVRTAELVVRGFLRAKGDIVQSQVACGGRLETLGAVAGGRVQCNGGLTCNVLGGEQGGATVIELADPRSHALLCVELKREIDRRRAIATNIRSKVEPFIKELKRLSPQQREKATELLAHAAEIEESLEAETTRFNEYRQRLVKQAMPALIVRERSFPNVTVRFAGQVECVLNAAIVGPYCLMMVRNGETFGVELKRESDKEATKIPCKPIAGAASNSRAA